MSHEEDTRKRRGIDGAARALQKQQEQAGNPITFEVARNRVRTAVINSERKKER